MTWKEALINIDRFGLPRDLEAFLPWVGIAKTLKEIQFTSVKPGFKDVLQKVGIGLLCLKDYG